MAPFYPSAYGPRPPMVAQRYYTERPPAQRNPPQYSYDERSERSFAQITPPPAPAPRMTERITLSAKELFAFDSARLQKPQPRLDEIAAALQRNPQIGNVRITGYTDRIGTNSYNLKLSEQRANAVRDYLVAKGVAQARLAAVGRGKANPVVECH